MSSTADKNQIKKKIDKILKEPICAHSDLSVNERFSDDFYSQIDPIVFQLMSLRLKQLGLDVTVIECLDLILEELDIHFWLEMNSNYSFKQIATFPKRKLQAALKMVRKRNGDQSTDSLK